MFLYVKHVQVEVNFNRKCLKLTHNIPKTFRSQLFSKHAFMVNNFFLRKAFIVNILSLGQKYVSEYSINLTYKSPINYYKHILTFNHKIDNKNIFYKTEQ